MGDDYHIHDIETKFGFIFGVKKAVDEFNQKNKEIKDAIKDGINCVTKR